MKKLILLVTLLFIPAITYAVGCSDTGLLRYFNFEEGVSSYTVDCKSNDVMNFSGNVSWITGKIGNGINTGTTGFGIDNTGMGLSGLNAFTLNVWIRMNYIPDGVHLFTTLNVNKFDWQVTRSAGYPYIRLEETDGTCFLNNTNIGPSTGTWHLWSIVWSSGATCNIYQYVDGNLLSREVYSVPTAVNSVATDTSGIRYFGNSDNTSFLNADVDDLAIYNYRMTPTQIMTEYTNAGTPVLSSIIATSISTTTANITWTTDISANSLVDYGPTTSYGNSSTLDENLVTSHSVNLTGLTQNTTYHYRVTSKGVVSNDNVFSTLNTCYMLILKRSDLAVDSFWDIGDIVIQTAEENFKGWGDMELNTDLFLTTKVYGSTGCYLGCLAEGTTSHRNREYQIYTASVTSEMSSMNFCNSLNKKVCR